MNEKTRYAVNSKHKKAKVTILISEKVELKTKSTTRGKERHFIMVKRDHFIMQTLLVKTYM